MVVGAEPDAVASLLTPERDTQRRMEEVFSGVRRAVSTSRIQRRRRTAQREAGEER
jgi:hypothetical protein